MAYKKRIPPIKLEITIKKYNLLIEYLTIYEKCESENIVNVAKKIKEKLLKYSVPRIGEDCTQIIDARFYPQEAEQVISLIVNCLSDIELSVNYYEVLLQNRSTLKQFDDSGAAIEK